MKHCKTPLSVNIRMRKKEQKDTKRRKCLLCTTTKEQWLFPITPAAKQQQAIEMWMGKKNILVWVQRVGYLHWALKHLFCLLRIILVVAAFLFLSLSRRSFREKKRGSRSRCVIKCNLNWMANEKGKAVLSEKRVSRLRSVHWWISLSRQMLHA